MSLQALAVAFLLAAPAADAPDEAALRRMVEEAIPRVARAMALPLQRVPVKVVSQEQALGKLRAQLVRDFPGDRLERLARALQLFRVVEAKAEVAATVREEFATHASGFYDATDKVLYLLAGQPKHVQAMVVAHEVAHAFQDTLLDLDAENRARLDSEDERLAFVAAVEGQAQAVAQVVMGQGFVGDAEELEKLFAGRGAAIGRWVALQLDFPADAGATFLQSVISAADPVGMRVLQRLPSTTAELLDPSRYREGRRVRRPLLDLLGLLEGSQRVFSTSLGTAGIDLFGAGLGEGWQADRLEVVDDHGVVCGVWAAAFETEAQARRFATAYAARPAQRLFTWRRHGARVTSSTWKGTVAIVLEQVPLDRAEALRAAARTALHERVP